MDETRADMATLPGAEYAIDPVSLRAVPVDAAAMAACARALEARAHGDSNPAEAARSASMAALQLALLGHHEQARQLVEFALARQPATQCPYDRTVTEIRGAQLQQLAGQLADAESLLAAIVARCRSDRNVERLLDFALQHHGKVLFDMGLHQRALECFQEALALRTARKDPELTASTELAIAAATRRLAAASIDP